MKIFIWLGTRLKMSHMSPLKTTSANAGVILQMTQKLGDKVSWKLSWLITFSVTLLQTPQRLMNYFCGLVDRRVASSLVFSQEQCQRFSPSQISDMLRAEFEQEPKFRLCQMKLGNSDNYYTTAPTLKSEGYLKVI